MKLMFRCLTLLVLLAGPISAAGAVEPCLPDCETDLWSGTLTTILVLPGGCAVKVEYKERTACGLFNDLYIERIEPLNPNDPSCRALGLLSTKHVVDQVAKILVTIEFDDPHNPPPPGTCETNWRVVAGCWCRKELPGGDCGATRRWGPCDSGSCCLKPYSVCVDPIGSISVTPQPGTSSADCSTATSTCGTESCCESVCD